MYKGNFSNSFVKWAVILFLFPVYAGGLVLRAADYLIKKTESKKETEI